MPFCIGFAARTAGAGRKLEASGDAAGRRRHRRRCRLSALQRLLDAAHEHLTGNPLFPYFNDYWHSPLALPRPIATCASCRPISGAQLFFPILFSLDWHVADDLGFQDIRVGVAYLLVIAALVCLACRAAKAAMRCSTSASRAVLSPLRRVAYFVWLRTLRHLPLHHPARDAGAASDHRRRWDSCPLPRRSRYLILGAIAACCHAVTPAAISWSGRRWTIPISRPRCPNSPSRQHHGADDRRRAAGLHRPLPAAANSRAADRRLDGAAAGRHRAHQGHEAPGRGAAWRPAAIFI